MTATFILCAVNAGALELEVLPKEEVSSNDETSYRDVPQRTKQQPLPVRLTEERKHREYAEVRPTIHGFDNPLTQQWISRYSAKSQLKWIAAALRTGEPYLGFIRTEVERRKIPPELVYLPVLESAFSITAHSRSGARGLWQFMRNSMGSYMKLDEWRDERLDFWKSTHGALSKLEEHYKELGDWPLALAAYNSGGGAINGVLKANTTRDYWQLAASKKLKTESAHYVPKLLALYYIISNPRKFGLDSCYPAERYTWMRIDISRQVNLAALAEYAGIESSRLWSANRELSTLVTPPGSYQLKVRTEDAPAVQAVLERSDVQLLKNTFYTIKEGDTLFALALHYGVSVKQILAENPGLRPEALRPGNRVSIPQIKNVAAYSGAPAAKSAPASRPPDINVTALLNNWKGAYTVTKGDTLWSIARHYGISPEALAAVNGISSKGVLSIGKVLRVP